MAVTDLTVDLPFGVSPEEARTLLAIKLYQIGRVSLGQAARTSGHSKRTFMEILGKHEVPIFDYSPEELREETGR